MAKQKRKPTGFIRVRGRVVPIFGKKHSKRREGFEGAANVAAGASLAFGGGITAGLFRKKSRFLSNVSKSMNQNIKASISPQLSLFGKGKNISFVKMPNSRSASASIFKAIGTSAKTVKKAERASILTGKAFRKSRLVSASLIGLGVEKLITASGVEKNDFVSEFASEASGVGAAFVSDSLSNRAFLKVSMGESFRKGLSKDAVKGLSSVGNFLKMAARRKLKI